jgi:predicted MPP superfamily phosphohydrolase
VGNHDDDDAEWGNMKKHLEEKNILFLEEPKDMQTLQVREAHICIHGVHTLLDRLNTMSVDERNTLLDSHIHLLTQTKTDFHIVLLHNPDGIEYLLQRLKETQKSIQTPTLFLA